MDKRAYEILVVDNNSRDETRAVAQQFCNHYANVRYYLELRQGLSYARNSGFQKARGEYVAYIDDDCKAPKHWLCVAKDIIERLAPDVFGGPSYSFYNSRKPLWYKDSYSSHEPYKEARILNGKECINIYGMNMVIRTKLLQALGGFDPDLGMCGEKIAYGEEAALLKLIGSALPDQLVYYDPNLYVYHLVQSEG